MHIFGASGHGKVILDILKLNKLVVSGFIDDNESIHSFCGLCVQQDYSVEKLIIAIGDNKIRETISALFSDKIFVNAIHPRSIIASNSKIKLGTAAMAGAVINSDVVIGSHVIINTNATVEHDCVVDDFVHISPGSTLCGHVHVSKGSHIGANAVVVPGIKIGKWCKIGAGAVVIKDLPDYSTAVGNPARVLK